MSQPETKTQPPMNPTDFMILVAVAAQPLHGYAIAQSVEMASEGRVRIGLGSLYRFIARLTEAGLIRETRPEQTESNRGKQRRTYEITEAGRLAVRDEAIRMRDAIVLARAEKLLVDE